MPTNLSEVIQELRRLKRREQELLLVGLSSDAPCGAGVEPYCHKAWVEANSALFCALMNHLDALLDAASRSLEGGSEKPQPFSLPPRNQLTVDPGEIVAVDAAGEAVRLQDLLVMVNERDETIAQLRLIVKARTHREKGCLCPRCLEDEYDTAKVFLAKDAELERLRGLVRELREESKPTRYVGNPLWAQERADYDAATEAMLIPLDTDTVSSNPRTL